MLLVFASYFFVRVKVIHCENSADLAAAEEGCEEEEGEKIIYDGEAPGVRVSREEGDANQQEDCKPVTCQTHVEPL